MSRIIQNGIIVTQGDTYKADLEIREGKIVSIANKITPASQDDVIDAEDQYVLPGGIDPHTHLAIENTLDDFESGTRAAAAGGITSIINFTDPQEGQSVIDNLNMWKRKAEKSIIDYGFHSIINKSDDNTLTELAKLPEEGVTSIKLFTAYRGKNMVEDMEIYKLMKAASSLGIVTNVHAENGDIIDEMIAEALEKGQTDPIYHARTRPSSMEAEATHRVLRIAETLDAPIYIVHVTCEEALNQVVNAKKRGVYAYAETCPHYLILDESYLEKPNSEAVKYICSPPLRTKNDQEKLWEGIMNHSVSTIGSDHASHPYKNGKILGKNDFTKAPNGLPGIESSIPLLFHYGVQEKRISLQKLVEITSANPAKIFGMYPKKGSIMVGSDADIVILDPSRSKLITQQEQHQSTEYNIYEGIETKGAITHVLSRGEVIVKHNEILGGTGRGEFIYRKKFKH